MSSEQSYFEAIIENIPNATLSALFGKPCGKINKKAFVAFYQNEMVFKLGRVEVEDRLKQYEGAQKWDPSGKKKPMKDWIQVPGEYQEDWSALAQKAMEYLEGEMK